MNQRKLSIYQRLPSALADGPPRFFQSLPFISAGMRLHAIDLPNRRYSNGWNWIRRSRELNLSLFYRLRQGLSGLRPVLPPTLDSDLRAALTPDQISAFKRLTAYDQLHLLRVYRFTRVSDPTNTNLHQAALLHDLGKAALGGRVRLINRAANVLLAKVTPRLNKHLARLPASRWRLGLALALHHPELGAAWAEELGCSERCVWLIRHHADDPAPDDLDLLLLIHADRSV